MCDLVRADLASLRTSLYGELPAMPGRVTRSSEVLSGTSLFCFAHGVGVATSARVKATA